MGCFNRKGLTLDILEEGSAARTAMGMQFVVTRGGLVRERVYMMQGLKFGGVVAGRDTYRPLQCGIVTEVQ